MHILQSGETAAHVAARYGHLAVIEFLVAVGTDMDIQDSVSSQTFHSVQIRLARVKTIDFYMFGWLNGTCNCFVIILPSLFLRMHCI